ncbi:MAG: RING finger domain-containing protein [Promethearchaeota archaeon]
MPEKNDLKDDKSEDEISNLRLLLYGESKIKESRIYYSSQSDCFQQSIEYLNSLNNIEIKREHGYFDIEYIKKKEDDKEPYWNGTLEIVPEELGSRIKFNFDFKDYFKQFFLLGVKGSVLISIFLTIIVGSYNISNLIELWFILTIVGIIGISFLFISAFLLDRSENSQQVFMKKFSDYLDRSESKLITKALEEFRKTHIEEKIPEMLPKKVICINCKTKNKYSSTFCINCGMRVTGCSICLLKIGASEEILRCPHCNSIAHKSHLLEWLKVKGVCPVCKKLLKWVEDKLV